MIFFFFFGLGLWVLISLFVDVVSFEVVSGSWFGLSLVDRMRLSVFGLLRRRFYDCFGCFAFK